MEWLGWVQWRVQSLNSATWSSLTGVQPGCPGFDPLPYQGRYSSEPASLMFDSGPERPLPEKGC